MTETVSSLPSLYSESAVDSCDVEASVAQPEALHRVSFCCDETVIGFNLNILL